MHWAALIPPAVVGVVVSAVLSWSGRKIWRSVLVPVGEAARAVGRLAGAVTDAQMIPELDAYLHKRMHELVQQLAAIRLGQQTFPAELVKLHQLVMVLQATVADLTEAADRLAPPAGKPAAPPPGG